MHKKIMIQGTGSSVGKSVIVAGLARIFAQDGKTVSPFKSQNMALNSFVDIDGLEMGRATVVQAECGKSIPHAFMNPILLKPNEDNNSQVIIEGRATKNMNAQDYFNESKKLKEIAKRNYDIIEKNYDIGVLEGGGSPAEINLRQYDLVNMGMAEMVDAPVILVGNIEIGGVFASIYGTIALLDKKDRDRIAGYIINKFRGDRALLQPGIDMLDDRLAKEGYDIKCLGVIPYEKLQIEEEDVLAKKINENANLDADIKITVVRTDKMSNYTDFDSLSYYDDVSLKYAFSAKDLGNEDVIILPGSKNTIRDLEKLKANGMYDKILKLHEKGSIVVGICGGFQMLGQEIKDPYKLESNSTNTKGFEILPTETIMEKDKFTKQVNKTLPSNLENTIISGMENENVLGYEIHQGVTKDKNGNSQFFMATPNAFGTYIHGIFDNGKFTRTFLNNIRKRKGLEEIKEYFDFNKFKENEYDKLANLLRNNLNIEEIYKIMR